MRRLLALTFSVAALGGCVSYHQEDAALRMARPSGTPTDLADYAGRSQDYPSVGGDILKGAGSTAGAAYQATTGDNAPQ
jgi:hypothetical protein